MFICSISFQTTVRYFSAPTEDGQKNNKELTIPDTNKTIVFDVKEIRKKPWGRRKADKKIKKKKINQIVVKIPNPNPKFKGKVKPSSELIEKYSKGEGVNLRAVRTSVHQKKIEKKEKRLKFAVEEAARTEILLTEDSG